MADSSRIRIGVLARPHGLEGAIRCMLDNPTVPVISTPCEVAVGFSEAFSQPRTLVGYKPGRTEIICSFKGVVDRDKAMELTDQALFVPQEALSYEAPYTDPGLVGFEVWDEERRMLGHVTGILRTNAHYIWQIEEDGREWMLPAIDEFVTDIDEEAGKILVRLIPGLYRDDEVEGTSDDRGDDLNNDQEVVEDDKE